MEPIEGLPVDDLASRGDSSMRRLFAPPLLAMALAGSPAVAAETAFTFDLPARIVDFPGDPAKQQEMLARWQVTMDAFAKMGIAGNPWANVNDTPRSNYLYPPDLPAGASGVIQPVTWTAFPNKVAWYFSNSQDNPYQVPKMLLYPLADNGRLDPTDPVLKKWAASNGLTEQLQQLVARHPEIASPDLSNFAPLKVPDDVCPVAEWNKPDGAPAKRHLFSQNISGPRGWKDEYNEWVVTRNAEGKITKISFTAENPEYWFTLWEVDPERVLALYRELVSPKVKLDDLYLRAKPAKDGEPGAIVRDQNGKPVYNPLNKWNYGNAATDEGGGAVHLTSPPNTVGAEIYLGAAATILRALGDTAYSPMNNICAAEYGSPFRNSDPNIGFQANQVVHNIGATLTLTNPIALYMQTPDFSNYVTPDGTPASAFFRIVRGRTAAEAGVKYDQILHAVFEVPEGWGYGYTVSDIKIGGRQIWWGSQMAETFNQALAVTAYPQIPATNRLRYPAVQASASSEANPWPQPIVTNAALEAVTNQPAISSATIPLLPLTARPGQTLTGMALEVIEGTSNATIRFVRADGAFEPGIKATVKSSYSPGGPNAVPGKHKLYSILVYVVDITVADDVAEGQYGVQVVNPGRPLQIATPGGLTVAKFP